MNIGFKAVEHLLLFLSLFLLYLPFAINLICVLSPDWSHGCQTNKHKGFLVCLLEKKDKHLKIYIFEKAEERCEIGPCWT